MVMALSLLKRFMTQAQAAPDEPPPTDKQKHLVSAHEALDTLERLEAQRKHYLDPDENRAFKNSEIARFLGCFQAVFETEYDNASDEMPGTESLTDRLSTLSKKNRAHPLRVPLFSNRIANYTVLLYSAANQITELSRGRDIPPDTMKSITKFLAAAPKTESFIRPPIVIEAQPPQIR